MSLNESKMGSLNDKIEVVPEIKVKRVKKEKIVKEEVVD